MTELDPPRHAHSSIPAVRLPRKYSLLVVSLTQRKTVSFLGFPQDHMDERESRQLRDRTKLAERRAERLATQEPSLSFMLRSGSKWKQDHLNRLGVDFKMNEEFDICKFVFDPKTTLEWNRTYANSQSTPPRS
jgi:hypothetical protein